MAERSEIVEFLNAEFDKNRFSDSSLNGLQFEGANEVTHIAVAVDSGESVITMAAKLGAQFLLVHHGLIWDKPIAWTGAMRKILGKLSSSQLNLYAMHLPLDAHSEWGNNFTLARKLGLGNLRAAISYRGQMIACVGENIRGSSLEQFATELAKLPGAKGMPLTLSFGPAIPRRVCVVTGSGADTIEFAESEGFDTLVTGEPRQFAYHYCRDRELNLICAGHYATETLGVLEVGKALEKRFGVKCSFVDIPTGI